MFPEGELRALGPLGPLHPGAAWFARRTDAPLLMFVILPLMLFVLGAEISDHTIDSRAIALLGVLCAVGAV